MTGIRQRALAREILAGTWLNLGSSLTAEIAGRCGFDWLLIDLEHGAGGHESLVHQLQAIASTEASAIVRIAWNDVTRFKRALDLGPAGIMVPYVNNAEEARAAVSAMRYPPEGTRGVARFTRAASYGTEFNSYFARANESLMTIVQIETPEGASNAAKIAAIDGVDVLFVGPLDLSVNMGLPQQFENPEFRAVVGSVIEAAHAAGKAAGTLVASAAQIPDAVSQGFTFVAAGSDGSATAAGLNAVAEVFKALGADGGSSIR